MPRFPLPWAREGESTSSTAGGIAGLLLGIGGLLAFREGCLRPLEASRGGVWIHLVDSLG